LKDNIVLSYILFLTQIFIEIMLTLKKRRQNDDQVMPDSAGYRNIIETMSAMPETVRNIAFNYMTPPDLYAHLLMDNPKINITKLFLDYLHYLKNNIGVIRARPNGENIIMAFGLNVTENWKRLDNRSHLVNISNDMGLFLEYACWDCPFLVTMLATIQNNDGPTLIKYIEFYRCLEAECAIQLFECLVKYAFDFRRMTLISNIITAFSPLFSSSTMFEQLNASLSKLMTYFTENYKSYNYNSIVNEPVDFIKLVQLLENSFPLLYNYYQINWTGYAYHLVKHNDVSELMKLSNNLTEPYMALDYEVVVYALVKQKEGCLAILLSGFKWNDRRDEVDKARLSDLSKSDLEKMLYYVLQNMKTQQVEPEKGFDPSFTGYHHKFIKQSQTGIRDIYQVGEKRFHMNIYLKAMMVRQMVMIKWCNDMGENPSSLVQSIYNDIQERSAFNENIIKFMTKKLNQAIKGIDNEHISHDNVPELVAQFSDYSGMMFHQSQFEDPDIDVV